MVLRLYVDKIDQVKNSIFLTNFYKNWNKMLNTLNSYNN